MSWQSQFKVLSNPIKRLGQGRIPSIALFDEDENPITLPSGGRGGGTRQVYTATITSGDIVTIPLDDPILEGDLFALGLTFDADNVVYPEVPPSGATVWFGDPHSYDPGIPASLSADLFYTGGISNWGPPTLVDGGWDSTSPVPLYWYFGTIDNQANPGSGDLVELKMAVTVISQDDFTPIDGATADIEVVIATSRLRIHL